MRLSAVVTLCCASLFPVAVHAGRAALMVDPPTFAVPAQAGPEQVNAGVKKAMLGLRWAVDNERPGYLEGKYTGGGYWVRIGVSYVGSSVSIRYLTSNGLGFVQKGDKRYIHANYNKWINSLVGAIPRSVESSLNQ